MRIVGGAYYYAYTTIRRLLLHRGDGVFVLGAECCRGDGELGQEVDWMKATVFDWKVNIFFREAPVFDRDMLKGASNPHVED